MPKLRAVVVEDDINLGSTFKTVLEWCGFEVDYVSDSTLAIDTILAIEPDIILLDLQMPKMNGLQILQALRSNDKIAHTKVILLTANTYVLRDDAINNLADLVLVKPASVKQISDFAMRLVQIDNP